MNYIHYQVSHALGFCNRNEYCSVMSGEEKSVRTRDPAAKLSAIITSAQKLFAEQGYERTKMQDIADHANVA